MWLIISNWNESGSQDSASSEVWNKKISTTEAQELHDIEENHKIETHF